MGFINSVVVWMIILGVKNGELNLFNYFAFLNMVFGRQLVISSKNGFFRANNWKIFKNCILSEWMLKHELVMNNEVFHAPGHFIKEISLYFEQENIPHDMQLNIIKNKAFYTGSKK